MIENVVIETQRLIIRPYTLKDSSEVFSVLKDKKIYEYLPDKPYESLEEVEGLIDWIISNYDSTTESDFKYCFAVIEKATGKHVGLCGIGYLDYDRTQAEVFYRFGTKYWGKGFATETAKALLQFGFIGLGLHEIVAVVKPENIASKKVIEKVGFKYKGIVRGVPLEHSFYDGELYYSLSKEEFMKLS
jgi:ribosomal-protein-alanine N-acetyltransferase